LAAIPGEEPLAILRDGLEGASPDLAALIARALGRRGDRKAAGALERLLARGAPEARLAAAESLASVGERTSVPAILGALASEVDRFLEHALIHAFWKLAAPEDLE